MSDIELHYNEYGSGFPLVLIHGNGGNSECFNNQVEFFSQFYRVITVDTRGHGKSPRGTAPFSLSQFAEDLKCFLDRLGIKKTNILGFSDGGNIVLLFALKYPQYIEKLIVNSADLSPKGVKPTFQVPVLIGYGAVSLISKFDKKSVAKKEMLALMVNQPDIKPQELKKLTMPTLVIVGTKDIIKDKHSELIARSIPNSRFVRIKGGHSVVKQNSAEYNKAVYDFLMEN